MEQLLRCALTELEQGRDVALVAIASAKGSTPRGAGAAMIVGEGGVLAGTIGGGELEYRCAQIALDTDSPLLEYDLSNQQAAGLGMVCGGSTQVLFTRLCDGDLLRRALALIAGMEPGWLLLPLDGGAPVLESGAEMIFAPHPELTEQYLSLPLSQAGRIFLFGGGHVSLALSQMLDVLGYPYIVVDDREQFSGADRFPHALRALTVDFAALAQALTGNLRPKAQDCVCIMTRGHLSDADCLRFALRTPAGYIGLMGSRRKRDRVMTQLTEEGFADAPQRITTPIGIPLGGQIPAEVAVSIAAQLVEWRNRS